MREKKVSWFDKFRFFFEALQSYLEEGAFFHGASLAYYTLFSFVPIVYLATSIFGRIFGQKNMENMIVGFLNEQVGIQDTSGILQFLQSIDLEEPNVTLEIISVGVLVVGGSAFFTSLKRSMNDFFEIDRHKRNEGNVIISFLSFKFLSIGLLALFSLIVILMYFLQIFIVSGIDHYLSTNNMFVSVSVVIFENLLSIFVNFLIFSVIFKYVHDGFVVWRLAIYGGLITALLLFCTELILRYYLRNYFFLGKMGIAGSLFVILAWVNYSAQMVFLGAKFTALLGKRLGMPIK